MGAELKITDAETLRLAESLAAARGESLEQTIRGALEREQAKLAEERERKIEAVLAAARAMRAQLSPEWDNKTSKEIMDEICDCDGLSIK